MDVLSIITITFQQTNVYLYVLMDTGQIEHLVKIVSLVKVDVCYAMEQVIMLVLDAKLTIHQFLIIKLCILILVLLIVLLDIIKYLLVFNVHHVMIVVLSAIRVL